MWCLDVIGPPPLAVSVCVIPTIPPSLMTQHYLAANATNVFKDFGVLYNY